MTVSLTKSELFTMIICLNSVIGSLDEETEQNEIARLTALREKCRAYMREKIKIDSCNAE